MVARHMKRLALIGYGRIAPRHLEVFRALECEIVASCNRSERGRQKATSEGGIPRTYPDAAAMLDKERPDGVICCASADQMINAAGKILPFGIPTFLEKPPGISLAGPSSSSKASNATSTGAEISISLQMSSVLTA